MSNPMDKSPFANAQRQLEGDLMTILQQARANPRAFEEHIRMSNPAAYQQACQIRNSGNPRNAILQLAQQRGINPNILRMFGII